MVVIIFYIIDIVFTVVVGFVTTVAVVFSRGHATLHLTVSVRPSVTFLNSEQFRITAPAQPSATGLPCIQPCFFSRCLATL